MTSRRVRIFCPNCSRDLRIPVEALGRRGECKHCGHRFRAEAEAESSSDSWPAESGSSRSGSDEMTSSLALMVEVMEREFQQTWAQFSARQANALEELCAHFANGVAVPSAPALSDSHGMDGADRSSGSLALERRESEPLSDLAIAECVRLRDEANAWHSMLAERSAPIARLGSLIEELEAVRRERDALAAEATEVRARLVELEFSLVEAESAREECRESAQAERAKWKRQRHGLIAEARRHLAEQRGQIEAERRARIEQLQAHQRIEHEAQSLRIKVKKLRDLYDTTRHARDEALRAVEALTEQRARLGAWLDEAETERQELNRSHQAEIDRLTEALEEAQAEADSAQAELARHRRATAVSSRSPTASST
jgi:hypothetical protein